MSHPKPCSISSYIPNGSSNFNHSSTPKIEVGNGFHRDVNRFIPICTVLFPHPPPPTHTYIYIYTHTHTLTYLLTPWSRVLLEKLTGLQLVKKFPAFYGTRRFLTALTSARHLSLSWGSPIQSSYPNPTSWRSILILSSHLRLGLPSGLFPSGFPSSTLYTPLPSPIRATYIYFNLPS